MDDLHGTLRPRLSPLPTRNQAIKKPRAEPFVADDRGGVPIESSTRNEARDPRIQRYPSPA